MSLPCTRESMPAVCLARTKSSRCTESRACLPWATNTSGCAPRTCASQRVADRPGLVIPKKRGEPLVIGLVLCPVHAPFSRTLAQRLRGLAAQGQATAVRNLAHQTCPFLFQVPHA